MPIATPQGTLDFKSVDKVTFVGASSNTVIDTTTGSLGVGVGVGGPTSNLHVVGNALITGNVSDLNIVSNVNMLHTANTASIKLNSNVVTEFPRSKKLIKYPRVALTSASYNAYENGYKVTVSNEEGSHKAYDAFDGGKGANSLELWYSGTLSHYSTNDGSAVTSGTNIAPRLDTNTDYGEWIGIELPVAIKLRSFHLWQQYNDHNHFPQSSTLYAKRESSDPWTEIYRYDNRTRSLEPDRPEIFDDVDSERFYKHFALVCRRRVQGTNATTGVSLGEWELYGVPEYDPEAHGTDVVVKSVPNVPNTDLLQVYYEGKNYTSGNTVQDETANNRHGTLNGVGFDTEYKAFTFDGGNDYIRRDGIPTPTGSGNFVHTVSMWFKLDSLAAAYFLWGLTGENDGTDGNPSPNSTPHATVGTNGIISWAIWGNDIANQTAVVANRWYHCVWTYSGGTNGRKMFLNGIEQSFNASQTTALNMVNSTSRLTIGIYPTNLTSNPLKGSVANFRLFNRALTSDEIYQLYAYQKEYFGHGDLSMTLKAGRLGIGTSEPRAVLDVRGDIHGGCPVYFHARRTSGTTASVSGTLIVWNLLELGRGGGYDPSSGKFTAPIKGVYKFIYYARGDNAANNFILRPRYNGVDPGAGNTAGTTLGNEDGAHASAYLIHEMNEGDTLEILLYTLSGTMYISSYYNGFYGYYLSSL